MDIYYDDGSGIRANEKLRQDPEVRAVITELLDRQSAALLEAERLIAEAHRVLMSVPHYQNMHEGLYARVVSAVGSASGEIASNKQSIMWHTDTYVGNLAAFELGSVIRAELDRGYDCTTEKRFDGS